ncbi:MAG: hypothetical protein Kow0042_32150 [Calditrichia bacterium]
MEACSPEVLRALQMAMQNELDTVRIYRQMLQYVKNTKTRDILNRLIEEEYQHEKRIKDRFLQGGGKIPKNDGDYDLPNREQLLDLELKNFTISELISLAIQNEKISRDFYQAQLNRVDNPHVKEVFRWLVEQEEEHIRNLQNERDSHSNYEEVNYPG